MIVSTSPSTENYLISVARGDVSGATPWSSYGSKTTSGADSGILWSNGSYALPPAEGVQISLVSSSANDAAAGTGIRTVRIDYLNASLASATETVTLNGTTPVNTAATNIRFVVAVTMVTYGSGKSAGGNITISNGGTTYAYIASGGNRCETSVYMVPTGKKLFVTSIHGSASSGSAAAKVIIKIVSSYYGGVDYSADSVFITLASAALQDNSNGITIPCPMMFSAGQAVGMAFETDKGATIDGVLFGWMENA